MDEPEKERVLVMPGIWLFKMHTEKGLPPDIWDTIAELKGIKIEKDMESYSILMEEHKKTGRKSVDRFKR